MNPQAQQIPSIGAFKRSIEYQNYLYNQEQLQKRKEIHKRTKQNEVQQTAYQNHQALIEMQSDKIRQMRRKYQVQDTLQRQYDQQINTRRRIKTQERSVDKVYNQLEREMLQNNEKNRIHEMAKIYQIGSNQKKQSSSNYSKRLLTEGGEDSLDQFRHQSHQQFGGSRFNNIQSKIQPQQSMQIKYEPQQNQFQRSSSANYQKPSITQIEQVTTPLVNSRHKKYSAFNLDYADYLKRQIQRKQKEKEIQKRNQLEKDKTWINTQNQSYQENLQQMKYLNHKKKYDYATGLEQQLYWKKTYKRL